MARRPTLSKRRGRLVTGLLLVAYAVCFLLVLSWRLPSAGLLQPTRDEPVRIAMTPAEPGSYNQTVASNLRVEVQSEKLNVGHYLGWRPEAYLQISRIHFVPNVRANYTWRLSASRSYDYNVPRCTLTSPTTQTCIEEWRHAAANEVIEIAPLPSALGMAREADTDLPVILQFSFAISFPTLAVSEEREGDSFVDFSALTWVADTTPTSLLYPDPAKMKYDTLFGEPIHLPDGVNSMTSLREAMGSGSFITITICPSCMALRGYECATEMKKQQLLCSGSTNVLHRVSWSATRVDKEWRRASSEWILGGLLGTGAAALFVTLLARAVGRRSEPQPGTPKSAPEFPRRATPDASWARKKRRRR